MAITVNTEIELRIKSTETQARDLGTAKLAHAWAYLLSIANGTGATQNDRVWSDTRTANAAADTLDLLGTLTSQLDGSIVNFTDVCGFAIYNKETGTGKLLTVGAGANPWFSWLGATGDAVKIPPTGFHAWGAGYVDDYKPTAGTGDILTIDPGANSVTYDIIIWGRSA